MIRFNFHSPFGSCHSILPEAARGLGSRSGPVWKPRKRLGEAEDRGAGLHFATLRPDCRANVGL